MKKNAIIAITWLVFWSTLSVTKTEARTYTDPVDYVNILMGTQSEFELSNGNTYPAIAVPWGMNFWTPQTRKIGDGWQYAYTDYKINGFKQTHQPSPWMNDYGQFSIFPMVNKMEFDQEKRASWFSHKAEIAKPYYYSVYLADYDMTAEITPTERAAIFRFTFPEADSAFVLVDAFNRGSAVEILPDQNAIIGYTTRNSGGVPENFKNYFVVVFDKPFQFTRTVADSALTKANKAEANHTGAFIGFSTQRGEKVIAKVASSFISHEQAWLNLKEVEEKEFDTVKQEDRKSTRLNSSHVRSSYAAFCLKKKKRTKRATHRLTKITYSFIPRHHHRQHRRRPRHSAPHHRHEYRRASTPPLVCPHHACDRA